jgi:hypothetical protein
MISGQVPVRQIYVHDTWAARDLPVLDATISLLEHSYMVTVTDIADKAALDPSVVAQALEALDPIYVDFRKTTTGGDPRFWYVFKVTPEARRAVGQWPTAEALVSRLAQELSAAARREGDAEHQGLLMYAARLVGDTLRDAAVRAAGAVLAPAFGGIPVPEVGQQVPPPAPLPDEEFHSLVPLPELPELLRPQGLDGAGQAASAAAQPEPTPAPELPVPELLAPELPVPGLPVPGLPLPELSVSELSVSGPPVPGPPVPGPSAPEPAASAEPGPAPMQRSAVVADLTPWPDAFGRAETSAAAESLAPPAEPTPLRSPLGIWPAADADPDTADTDLDMAQARRDAV